MQVQTIAGHIGLLATGSNMLVTGQQRKHVKLAIIHRFVMCSNVIALPTTVQKCFRTQKKKCYLPSQLFEKLLKKQLTQSLLYTVPT
jgi:hypothetical protein